MDVILGVSHSLNPKGVGLRVPKIFWETLVLTCAHTVDLLNSVW